MRTVKLIVEYNGSNFHGWQKQPGLRTVQGELERVLSIILRRPSGPIHAAGRTDAGVHARGQVVTFRTEDEGLELFRVSQGVSHLMRGELSVISADFVASDFHPGISSTHKQYSYRILNRATPAVLESHLMWHVADEIEWEPLQREIQVLVGQHNFSSFRDSTCAAATPVKTIYVTSLVRTGDITTFTVVGSGFLKQMVRNIVGTVVDLGRGRIRGRTMQEILAPPHGLCMDWVSYEPVPYKIPPVGA